MGRASVWREGTTWDGLALRVAFFALGSALLIAARVLERGEPLSPRTGEIVALVLGGALGTGVITLGLAHLVARSWPRTIRFGLAAPLAAGGITALTYVPFAIALKFLPGSGPLGEIEHEPWRHAVLGPMLDALGLFLVTGAKYLLPWPLPAIALLGAALAAWQPAWPPARPRRPALRSRPAHDTAAAVLPTAPRPSR